MIKYKNTTYDKYIFFLYFSFSAAKLRFFFDICKPLPDISQKKCRFPKKPAFFQRFILQHAVLPWVWRGWTHPVCNSISFARFAYLSEHFLPGVRVAQQIDHTIACTPPCSCLPWWLSSFSMLPWRCWCLPLLPDEGACACSLLSRDDRFLSRPL